MYIVDLSKKKYSSWTLFGRYNIYFAGFVFCEFLNFSMVVLLIYLTHRFLHYRFLAYGFEVSFYSFLALQIFGLYKTW